MRLDGLKRKLLCLSLACSVGALAQGSPNALPALGDGLEMSTGAERQLGDRIARELYRSAAYVDDAILGDYVEGLWLRLMAAARQRGELRPEMDEQYAWAVMLGRDRSVNAFALPGATWASISGSLPRSTTRTSSPPCWRTNSATSRSVISHA